MNSPKTSDPRFSCGPTRKFLTWQGEELSKAPLGRYHRSDSAQVLLQEVNSLTKDALTIPNDFQLITLPGSCTGAIASIMANVLGERPVQAYSQGVFGDTWAADSKLYADNVDYEKSFCGLPDFTNYNSDYDTLCVFNETSTGSKLPSLDWIARSRAGLSIVDVTSSAFVNEINWEKVDIAVWSWQKCLSGEAGFASVAISPEAAERILTNSQKLPKIFRLKTKENRLVNLVNTLSLMVVQDVHFSLTYYLNQGGLETFNSAAVSKRKYVNDWLSRSSLFTDYVVNNDLRSDTVVYLKANDNKILTTLINVLAKNHIAYDITSHRQTPKGVRFWIGPSIPKSDVEILTYWLEKEGINL